MRSEEIQKSFTEKGIISWALNKDQKKSVKLTGIRSLFLTVKD